MKQLTLKNCHRVQLLKISKVLLLIAVFFLAGTRYFSIVEEKDIGAVIERLTKHKWILIEEGSALGFDKEIERGESPLIPLDGCLYNFRCDGGFEVFRISNKKNKGEKSTIWLISDGWWVLENQEMKLLFSEGRSISFRIIELTDNCLILEDEMHTDYGNKEKFLRKYVHSKNGFKAAKSTFLRKMKKCLCPPR